MFDSQTDRWLLGARKKIGFWGKWEVGAEARELADVVLLSECKISYWESVREIWDIGLVVFRVKGATLEFNK